MKELTPAPSPFPKRLLLPRLFELLLTKFQNKNKNLSIFQFQRARHKLPETLHLRMSFYCLEQILETNFTQDTNAWASMGLLTDVSVLESLWKTIWIYEATLDSHDLIVQSFDLLSISCILEFSLEISSSFNHILYF